MLRAGLYARVSTNDQQTLAMQNRAMREYAERRGWTIALQVREVNSGATRREANEKVLEAARRREIDLVLVWRLDRWGRSVTDLLATLQELEHLGVGFVSLPEALDLTTPAGRAMAGLQYSPNSKERFCGNARGPAWRMRGRTGNGWAVLRPRPYMLRKSGSYTAPVSANPKSPAGCRSAGHWYGASWRLDSEQVINVLSSSRRGEDPWRRTSTRTSIHSSGRPLRKNACSGFATKTASVSWSHTIMGFTKV
jgi:hypothetical protein